jgi:diaminohydroxyphosphoribosylaminopyrimidine deaminase/5-amino-6-(5-phosphoribosylamino)uracil reductase
MLDASIKKDNYYMRRALELALLGQGKVAPNPMVGCVVVHQDRIIGEGWHEQYGQAHAEVNAIRRVKELEVLAESTVYVNLEPCAHFGKTPPCADLLVQHRVKRVVVANQDPNPLVAGKGLAKLQAAGIEVSVGILAEEGRVLNKRFFTFMEQQRPYIVLKWAESSDNLIARSNYDSKWISSLLSRQRVHQWRTQEAAIMVGTQTALHDNPQLNARLWEGTQPLRLVIDRFLRLPQHLHLFDQSLPTWCYNTLKEERQGNLYWKKIAGKNLVAELLEDLYQNKIQSLLVEGGAALLSRFIEAGLWDEARVFQAQNTYFGEGIAAPRLQGFLLQSELLETDRLNYWQNPLVGK